MKELKCFSIKADEDSINWFVTTECLTFASPEASIRHRPYISCRCTTWNYRTEARPVFTVRGSNKPQGPVLSLDQVKALGLLPREVWSEYLKAIREEQVHGHSTE